MNELIVLIKKDVLEQIRSKKILILSIVFLFVAVSSPIFAKLLPLLLKNVQTPGLTISLPTPTFMDAVDQFVKNISQIAVLVLIFIAAGTVVDEKTRRNLEIVLTKPVSRTKFIGSKFASYLGSLTVIYAISVLIFYFYTISTFTTFNFFNFALMSGLILLYISMIVSVTILASTISKNSIAAAGLGFIAYIFFGTIVALFKSLINYSPDFIFSRYKDVLNSGWNHDFFLPVLVTLLIITLSVIAAILIFRTQEIER